MTIKRLLETLLVLTNFLLNIAQSVIQLTVFADLFWSDLHITVARINRVAFGHEHGPAGTVCGINLLARASRGIHRLLFCNCSLYGLRAIFRSYACTCFRAAKLQPLSLLRAENSCSLLPLRCMCRLWRCCQVI